MSKPKNYDLDRALMAAIVLVLYHHPKLKPNGIVAQVIEVMEELECRAIDGTADRKAYSTRIKQLLKGTWEGHFGVSLDYYYTQGGRSVRILEKSA